MAVVFINYLLVPLNHIDIKVSFEFYLFTMTGQSITNTCSLLYYHLAHVVILLSGLRGTKNAILATNKRR